MPLFSLHSFKRSGHLQELNTSIFPLTENKTATNLSGVQSSEFDHWLWGKPSPPRILVGSWDRSWDLTKTVELLGGWGRQHNGRDDVNVPKEELRFDEEFSLIGDFGPKLSVHPLFQNLAYVIGFDRKSVSVSLSHLDGKVHCRSWPGFNTDWIWRAIGWCPRHNYSGAIEVYIDWLLTADLVPLEYWLQRHSPVGASQEDVF